MSTLLMSVTWAECWADLPSTHCAHFISELLLIVLSAAIWGPLWSGQAVRFLCDNAAIVRTIHSGKSTKPLVLQRLRGLHLLATEHTFCFTASQEAGVENASADALSLNQAHLFLIQVPQAAQAHTPCRRVCCCTSSQKHHQIWLSKSWRQQLTSIMA